MSFSDAYELIAERGGPKPAGGKCNHCGSREILGGDFGRICAGCYFRATGRRVGKRETR